MDVPEWQGIPRSDPNRKSRTSKLSVCFAPISAILHAWYRSQYRTCVQPAVLNLAVNAALMKVILREQTMLSGYRVLVVEDNAIVAEDVSASIREAEGVVIGPCAGTREARALLKGDSPVDVAVLDVNVSDGSITPVLEALHARHVPTLIYTGGALPEACAAGTRTSWCSQSRSSLLASLPSCGGLPGQVWRSVRRPDKSSSQARDGVQRVWRWLRRRLRRKCWSRQARCAGSRI